MFISCCSRACTSNTLCSGVLKTPLLSQFRTTAWAVRFTCENSNTRREDHREIILILLLVMPIIQQQLLLLLLIIIILAHLLDAQRLPERRRAALVGEEDDGGQAGDRRGLQPEPNRRDQAAARMESYLKGWGLRGGGVRKVQSPLARDRLGESQPFSYPLFLSPPPLFVLANAGRDSDRPSLYHNTRASGEPGHAEQRRACHMSLARVYRAPPNLHKQVYTPRVDMLIVLTVSPLWLVLFLCFVRFLCCRSHKPCSETEAQHMDLQYKAGVQCATDTTLNRAVQDSGVQCKTAHPSLKQARFARVKLHCTGPCGDRCRSPAGLSIFFLALWAANSGLPMQSPSKQRNKVQRPTDVWPKRGFGSLKCSLMFLLPTSGVRPKKGFGA